MTKKMNTILPILLVVVVAIAALWYLGGSDETAGTGSVVGTSAEQFTADQTFTLYDWQGNLVTSDTSVKVVVTEHGLYEDVFAAEDERQSEGGLENPFGTSVFAMAMSPDASGEVDYTITTDGDGELFDVYIYDTTTGVATGNYNPQLETIKAVGYTNDDGNDAIKLVTGDGVTLGKTITLVQRGNISAVNIDDAAATTYTRDMGDEAVTDQSFAFDVMLQNDYAQGEYYGAYIAMVNDYVSTATLTLNEVRIDGQVVEFKEVADLSSRDPIYKNAPTADEGAGSDSTLYYIELDTVNQLDLTRISSSNAESHEIYINYDADMSDTGDDEAQFQFTFVSHAYSDDMAYQSETFDFVIGDNETAGFTLG